MPMRVWSGTMVEAKFMMSLGDKENRDRDVTLRAPLSLFP